MGMIGLLILLFVFKMQPADPPLEVMLIILSVVTAAAALQAAGGMDYLVNLAGKLLRSRTGADNFSRASCNLFFYVVCRYGAHILLHNANHCRSGY
jgi:anaerobic C4-dicarboxylate transporter DcuA